MAHGPIQMPPVPAHLKKDPSLYRWLQDLVSLFGADGGIAAEQIILSGKSLAELGTKNHSDLDNVLQANPALTDTTAGQHVTNAVMNGFETRIAALEATSATLTTSINTNTADIAALTLRVAQAETDILALQASQAAQDVTIADHEARLIAGGL